MTPHLIALFKEMSDLTAPECASNCRRPHSCCSPEYCEMAEDAATQQGIKLEAPMSHPTLRFMGPNGCVLEPHLRPLCTLHTCAVNSLGFKPGDPEWSRRYHDLRERIGYEMWMEGL